MAAVEAEGFREARIGLSFVLLLGVEVAQVTDGVGELEAVAGGAQESHGLLVVTLGSAAISGDARQFALFAKDAGAFEELIRCARSGGFVQLPPGFFELSVAASGKAAAKEGGDLLAARHVCYFTLLFPGEGDAMRLVQQA